MERCAILAQAVSSGPKAASIEEQARSFVDWMWRFVQEIGLARLWTGAGIDAAMCAALTKDVFAYMGRPMRQYRPVFSPEEVQAMFAEALMNQTKG